MTTVCLFYFGLSLIISLFVYIFIIALSLLYIHILNNSNFFVIIFYQQIDAENGLLISEFDTSIFSLTVIPIVGQILFICLFVYF